MATPLNDRAQKRARLSVLFGLIWLFIGLTWLILAWLLNGPLEPMLPGSLSQAGIALDRIIGILEKAGFILWVVSGLLCVITAFPQPENPRSWQGRVAILLAFLVLLIFIPPVICLLIWYWPQL